MPAPNPKMEARCETVPKPMPVSNPKVVAKCEAESKPVPVNTHNMAARHTSAPIETLKPSQLQEHNLVSNHSQTLDTNISQQSTPETNNFAKPINPSCLAVLGPHFAFKLKDLSTLMDNYPPSMVKYNFSNAHRGSGVVSIRETANFQLNLKN